MTDTDNNVALEARIRGEFEPVRQAARLWEDNYNLMKERADAAEAEVERLRDEYLDLWHGKLADGAGKAVAEVVKAAKAVDAASKQVLAIDLPLFEAIVAQAQALAKLPGANP